MIYLNTFKKSEVLEVFDLLFANNDTNLLFAVNLSEVTREQADEFEYLTLEYDPDMHRIFLNVFDPYKPLYPNPDAVCQLMPKRAFLKSIVPSGFYHQLMGK